jgi:hypothetical protein
MRLATGGTGRSREPSEYSEVYLVASHHSDVNSATV